MDFGVSEPEIHAYSGVDGGFVVVGLHAVFVCIAFQEICTCGNIAAQGEGDDAFGLPGGCKIVLTREAEHQGTHAEMLVAARGFHCPNAAGAHGKGANVQAVVNAIQGGELIAAHGEGPVLVGFPLKAEEGHGHVLCKAGGDTHTDGVVKGGAFLDGVHAVSRQVQAMVGGIAIRSDLGRKANNELVAVAHGLDKADGQGNVVHDIVLEVERAPGLKDADFGIQLGVDADVVPVGFARVRQRDGERIALHAEVRAAVALTHAGDIGELPETGG